MPRNRTLTRTARSGVPVPPLSCLASSAYVEAGDRSPTLAADEARWLADKLERATEHENGLDDHLRGLIEWLRDCADVLDDEMTEERLFIKYEREK